MSGILLNSKRDSHTHKDLLNYPKSSCFQRELKPCQLDEPIINLNQTQPATISYAKGSSNRISDRKSGYRGDRRGDLDRGYQGIPSLEAKPSFNKSSLSNQRVHVINTDSMSNKSYGFVNKKIDGSSCYTKLYDPRLFHAATMSQKYIDTPPAVSSIPLKDMYNDNKKNEKIQVYNNYSDITLGHVQYYLDKDISDPYHYPVYDIKSTVKKYTYKDPMDKVWNHYDRKLDSQDCSLSFIEDTSIHREELMQRQRRGHDSVKWNLRWTK